MPFMSAGLPLGADDGPFRAVQARFEGLTLETAGDDGPPLNGVAEVIEVKQFRRQREAAGVALAPFPVDPDRQDQALVARHRSTSNVMGIRSGTMIMWW